MNKQTFRLLALLAFSAAAAGCGGGGGGSGGQTSAGTGAPAAGAPTTGGGPTAPPGPEFYAAPTRVSDGLRFTSIAAGYHHTCAIETGGETYCWGSNEYGQLGSSAAMQTCAGGNFACSGAPVRVDGARQLVSLGASIRHTCGLDAAGEAYCWGFGLGGQLGDGLRQNSHVPVSVAGGLEFATLTASIASGSTCGITPVGDGWCWGINVGGELGNGAKTQGAPTPAPIATSTKLKAISLGQHHACALDIGGNALCWGQNWFGQLGVGSAGGSGGFMESFTPVAVLGGLTFVDVVAAGMHSCGLQSAGGVHCWGAASVLGTADAVAYESLPLPVVTTGAQWQRLGRGFGQTCAGAADGALYCWGQRTGPEGDAAVKLPTRIESDQAFTAFSAGGTHACAIGADGLAYCWGGNSWGQVGRPPSDP
jgi:alpha-tubulin suppressor-like RCC1 family protein